MIISDSFFALEFVKVFCVEIQVWIRLKLHFNRVLFPTIYKVVHNIWNTQYKTGTPYFISLMTNDSAVLVLKYFIWHICIVFLRNLFSTALEFRQKVQYIHSRRENKRRECTLYKSLLEAVWYPNNIQLSSLSPKSGSVSNPSTDKTISNVCITQTSMQLE